MEAVKGMAGFWPWRLTVVVIVICFSAVVVRSSPGIGHQRMVGGDPASKKNWPFIAHVNFHQRDPPWKVCGASLISKKFLVTAAHCVQDIPNSPEHITIGLGRTKRKTRYVKGQNYTVSKIIVNPAYRLPDAVTDENPSTIENDIALIKLSEEATGATPVKLASKDDQITKQTNPQCRAAGWGSVSVLRNVEEFYSKSYKISPQLKEIGVKIVSKQKCIKEDKIKEFPFFGSGNLDSLFCGGQKGIPLSSTACVGDSGSPLVCKDSNGKNVLQGIVAGGGDGLCRPGKAYMYFTEIAKFREWIDDEMAKNAD